MRIRWGSHLIPRMSICLQAKDGPSELELSSHSRVPFARRDGALHPCFARQGRCSPRADLRQRCVRDERLSSLNDLASGAGARQHPCPIFYRKIEKMTTDRKSVGSAYLKRLTKLSRY